jgi:hypothetical protein
MSGGVQCDADDQQDDGECNQGSEGFHLELSDPLHALVNLAMKNHDAKA